MTWLITIRTEAGERVHPDIADLAAIIASLPDDEPMGVTAMAAP